jgi:hypothetical protein
MTEMTLLTQPACTLCDHAKTVLGRVSDDYELHITEVSMVDDPGLQLARDAGVMFAPGLLIDGELFSHGRLSEKKLRRHLSARSTLTPRRS